MTQVAVKMWLRILLDSVIAFLLLLIIVITPDPSQGGPSLVQDTQGGRSLVKDELLPPPRVRAKENNRKDINIDVKNRLKSEKIREKMEMLNKRKGLEKGVDLSDLKFARSFNEVEGDENLDKVGGHYDKNLDTKEQYELGFVWGGYLFNDKGRVKKIEDEVTSSLVHSFSPYIERETAKRFVDPPHDQVYFANSPAVKWHNGELVLVSRIWLDRERYEPKENWPPNHFADNWLYTQKYDKNLKPISSGEIMGIPLPKQWWVGDGPIEPRLCKVKDKLFITFNAAMAFGHGKFMDFTIMYDYDEHIPIVPKIKGGTPMVNATEKDDMPRDKHWMALIQNDELYFVHNLDPLRIMKCSFSGDCDFVHSETNKKGFIFEHHVSHLRGGTPFELYEGDYFISVAHSTMYKSSNHHRFYTAHLIVLCVKPYRIVYVSNDIKVHGKVYELAPMVRPRWIEDGFIFPVGLLVESPDSIVLGVHVNDFSSVLIRIKGIKELMRTVIDEDKRVNSGIEHGPPIGYLQQHVHDVMQNLTHLGFVH